VKFDTVNKLIDIDYVFNSLCWAWTCSWLNGWASLTSKLGFIGFNWAHPNLSS